jgi:hypothetical protein
MRDWAVARAEVYVWPDYDLHRTPEASSPQAQARVRPLAGRRRTARQHARAPMPARRRDGPARTVPRRKPCTPPAASANEGSSTPTRGRWRDPSRPRRACRRPAARGMGARSGRRPSRPAMGDHHLLELEPDDSHLILTL